MDHGIYTAEMGNPPSPNEGPVYKTLKDKNLQETVLIALEKGGINIDGTPFEIYYQKGKLYVIVNGSFKIEFRSGEHYTGKGDNLRFLDKSIEHIKLKVQEYNKAVQELRNLTRANLDLNNIMSEELSNQTA